MFNSTISNDKMVTFTRINNDTHGNPRLVCHFLDLDIHGLGSGLSVSERYALACELAKSIGGRKYHTRDFGGGIAFSSRTPDEIRAAIARVTGKEV